MADEPIIDRTSATLLMRLAQSPRDDAAWADFVRVYGEQMYQWCRRWGLQDADARDVTQRVLLTLAQRMPTFTYDKSKRFRGWLRTVAHHAWTRYLDEHRRPGRGAGDSGARELLDSVEARDDLTRRLEEEFDMELLQAAMAAVRQRVKAGTWEAFRLVALEGKSGEETARLLGVSVDLVFKARSNVTKLLREEMQQLEE
jgi:RNA polymerase sigma-70 factor (ECF subfamily)